MIEDYPELKNKKGIEIQRYKIAPIGVGSQHDGRSLTINKKSAEAFAKQIEHTPLLYADYDNSLPKSHKDKYKNRKVVGTALKGFISKDENGIDWLMGDYAIYTDAEPDIVKKIKKFKDDVSASYEITQSLVDSEGNIHTGEYEATSIVDKDFSAYRHHALLVADKFGASGDQKEITYDEVLKTVVGNDYKRKLTEQESEIQKLKNELESFRKEKESEVITIKDELNKLREIATGFSKLV